MRRAARWVWAIGVACGIGGCGAAPSSGGAEVVLPYADASLGGYPSGAASAERDAERARAAAARELAGPWDALEDAPGAPELAAGAAKVRAADWAAAEAELAQACARLAGASLDVRLAGLALWGRAAVEAGDEEAATRAFGAIHAAWQGDRSLAELDALGEDGSARIARRKRALGAVGEALLHDAEVLRKSAEGLRPPGYSGPPDDASIRAHVDGRVVEWTRAREEVVRQADDAYAMALELAPAAPPRLIVRAAARRAQLWGRFTAELRTAPIPEAWTQEGSAPGGRPWADVRKAYYRALDEVGAPRMEITRARFEACQKRASELAWADPYSKSCDDWLARKPR